MGIQDRDYWREWYNKNHSDDTKPSPIYNPKEFRRKPFQPESPPVSLPLWTVIVLGSSLVVASFLFLHEQKRPPPQTPVSTPAVTAERSKASQPSLREQYDPHAGERAARHQLATEQARQQAQASVEAEARREAAWKAFYRRSPSCDANPTTTDCANEFIRARWAFEARYDRN